MIGDGVVGVRRAGQAVLQDDRGDAVLVEPVGNVPTFLVDDELGVAAAGRDHQGRAVGFVFGRKENIDGRIMHHREALGEFGVVGFFEDFLRGFIFGTGRTFWPEPDFVAAVDGEGESGEEETGGEEFHWTCGSV